MFTLMTKESSCSLNTNSKILFQHCKYSIAAEMAFCQNEKLSRCQKWRYIIQQIWIINYLNIWIVKNRSTGFKHMLQNHFE